MSRSSTRFAAGGRQELEILAVSYDRIVIAPFTEPPGGEVDTRCGQVAAASLTLA